MEVTGDRRLIAYSAAAMYAGATLVVAAETAVPGGNETDIIPMLLALGLAALAALAGPQLPRRALSLLGPLGAALVAFSLQDDGGIGDGAVLYMWPAVWTAYFYGTRGTVLICVWIGVLHALVLPRVDTSVDRWIDVMIAVIVVAGVVRFLGERNERLVGQLVEEARVDALTGLLNRRGFQERLAVERSRLGRDEGPAAVVALDIDHFKRVNDDHGHDTGDRVLAWIGQRLAEESRGVDVVARVGGEEFAIVAPRAGPEAGHALAERIRHVVQDGRPEGLTITVSLGVAVATTAEELDTAIAAADRELYAAKRAGRNRTRITYGGS
jgi:diguanylate cyclase (GGDEF)-like protein